MNNSIIHTLSNRKVSRIIFYGLASSYVVLLFLQVVISQFKGITVIAILIGLYFLRHMNSVLNHPKYYIITVISPLVEVVLLFLLFFRSNTEIESIVFVLFVADLLLHYKAWYAFPFAYGGFLIYLFLWPVDESDSWQHVFDLLSYSCLVIPIWSIKLLLNQRDINHRLNEALLQEAKTNEEMAALKERTRIAEEVHDTVGHTLTTAIVALEGAQLLFDHKPEEARRRIIVAREQLKQGLGNIRGVVKTWKATEGTEGRWGLKERIQNIMDDTAKQTGVQFNSQYEVVTPLIPLQEYVLINTIKESITNALKHGKATVIQISVKEQQDIIHLMVKDNGRVSDFIVYGFGLKLMEERIVAVGGQLSVESEPTEGVAIHAWMPVAREKNNG